MQSWVDREAELAAIARRQLFFVDGQPRSGTTWLQQLLDSHPDISCRGEAAFRDHLAAPLDRVMRQRYQELHQRNGTIFRHSGGYPLPEAEDTQYILATAVLLAFRQQAAAHQQATGQACQAIGEKTPGNIFFYPQLRSLFPTAKLISIARDPRDIITSNWHRFQNRPGAPDSDKMAFIRQILPIASRWMRTILAYREQFPDGFRVVTYESLQQHPAETLAPLLRFLGVADRPELIARCFEAAAFEKQTGGRPAGVAEDGAFLRKGIVGDWPSTLTPAMNALVLDELGWSFPHFGWQP